MHIRINKRHISSDYEQNYVLISRNRAKIEIEVNKATKEILTRFPELLIFGKRIKKTFFSI